MKKYKVEFIQTETFIVDVYAKDETEARTKADQEFQNENYQEIGDCKVETGNVYDLTETDNGLIDENTTFVDAVEVKGTNYKKGDEITFERDGLTWNGEVLKVCDEGYDVYTY